MSAELFITKFILPFLLWLALCAILLGIILEARKRMRKPIEGTPHPTDDFAEFYLDLHRYGPDAHFTREEAEALYRVWQRREKARSKNISNV